MSGGISAVPSGYRATWPAGVGAGGEAASVEVSALRDVDVARAVTLYREAFPDAFFGRLGRAFLTEIYASYLASPYAFVLAVHEEGRLRGLLAASVDAREHRRHTLSRHGRRLAVRGALGLLRHPRLVLSFVRRRLGWYARTLVTGVLRPAATEPDDGSGAVAVLDHVLVDPSVRGKGWGRQLVERFVAEAREAGASRTVLVTRADNAPARRLYESLGWSVAGEHVTRDGSRVVRYECVLAPSSTSQTNT